MTPLAKARWWANVLVELLEDELRRSVLEKAAADGDYWLGGQDNVLDDADLVTTAQAAEIAGTTPANIRTWAHRGKLDKIYFDGRATWYRADDVRRLAAS